MLSARTEYTSSRTLANLECPETLLSLHRLINDKKNRHSRVSKPNQKCLNDAL